MATTRKATATAATKRAAAPKDAERSTGGRPTLYRKEYVEQVTKLCQLGASDVEIAGFFGIAKKTLQRWQIAHPEFRDALKLGKEVPDERVKRSLYAAAIGYEMDDVDIRVIKDRVVMTKIRRHVAPSVVACIFWLKNRDRENWRDRPEEVGNQTPEEAARAAQEAIAAAVATSGGPV